MITCKELNRDFESKEQMFSELLANKDRIISLKKSAVKFSDATTIFDIRQDPTTQKSVVSLEDGYIYPVINTTKILDSHGDLHIDGLWNKTLKEQKGLIHYLVNHELKIGKVVAYPQDVEAFVKTLSWSDLGKSYEGDTQALIFKVKVQEYANEDARKVIDSKIPVQNSVSMLYKKIELAINSELPDYKENKVIFDEYYDKIANKADFKELDYFWVVKEAAIHREGSMVPIGSNQETPILYPKSESVETDNPIRENEPKSAEISLTDENLAFVNAVKKLLT